MLTVEIPGEAELRLEHLVCDLNGTLAVDGALVPGVAERLAGLSQLLAVHVLTAGTHGGIERAQAEIAAACGAVGTREPVWRRDIQRGADKAAYVRGLGGKLVVALGNGANDVAMFQVAALAIAVLGREGASAEALAAARVAVTSPLDALDLLRLPRRLTATLRR